MRLCRRETVRGGGRENGERLGGPLLYSCGQRVLYYNLPSDPVSMDVSNHVQNPEM